MHYQHGESLWVSSAFTAACRTECGPWDWQGERPLLSHSMREDWHSAVEGPQNICEPSHSLQGSQSSSQRWGCGIFTDAGGVAVVNLGPQRSLGSAGSFPRPLCFVYHLQILIKFPLLPSPICPASGICRSSTSRVGPTTLAAPPSTPLDSS